MPNPFTTTCPNCSAIWGWAEIEADWCSSCGYPAHDNKPQEKQEEKPEEPYDSAL